MHGVVAPEFLSTPAPGFLTISASHASISIPYFGRTLSPYGLRDAIKIGVTVGCGRADHPKLSDERGEGIEISPSASPSLPESSQGQRVHRTDSRGLGRRRAGLASSSLLRVSQSAPVVSSLLPPSLYRPIEPLLELHRIRQQFVDPSHGFLHLLLRGFLEPQALHALRLPSAI